MSVSREGLTGAEPPSAAPSSRGRPNFSGDWILDAARTKLQLAQLANLERAELRIEHRDPKFRLWRRFVLGGQEHTIDFELRSDGEETASVAGTQRRVSRLTWDGDALLFTTRLEDASGTATNVVRYGLLDEGRTLLGDERFRGPQLSYDNLWVFERSAGRHFRHDTSSPPHDGPAVRPALMGRAAVMPA